MSRTLLSESSVSVDCLRGNGVLSRLLCVLSGVGGIISSSDTSSGSIVDPGDVMCGCSPDPEAADSPVSGSEEA